MKILFYCQHLLGIGHVTRSLSLVNELQKDFSVTYVQGGPPVPLVPGTGVNRIQLAPLLMREADSSLYDPEGKRGVEEIFTERRAQLQKLSEEGFDAAVIELYPFGRKKFGPEVNELLNQLAAKNPNFKAVCSVRDILVEKADSSARNAKIVALLKAKFHQVWVHSDPALIRFAETFPPEKEISDLVRYTGFVAEPPKATAGLRKKQIVLSLGGGSVGEELFRAAALIVEDFPDYSFLFITGPYTNPAIRTDLESCRQRFPERVSISGLLPNFEEVLNHSALSLSMAGYNTVMNLLNTRTPGLVLTYDANHEQRLRSKLLEAKGFLTVLEPADLASRRLVGLMRKELAKAYPANVPNLAGASHARELLVELLN